MNEDAHTHSPARKTTGGAPCRGAGARGARQIGGGPD